MNQKTLLLLYLCIIIYQDKYNFYYPTLPIYPDNHQEVELVKNMIHQRDDKDIDDFKKTDISVAYLFGDYTEESGDELRKLTTGSDLLFLVKLFKNIINRARPYQIDPMINNVRSLTSHTPAYPAGHAFQAYYLARILSIKYPEKEELWNQIAERCDIVRIKAGLHYPSDGQFSKRLVDYFFDFLYDSK